ncbi:MAG: hypothetical protein KC475_05825 [Cyanobacteria bacterium HKST-UBA03]|nr:hypothetical protein [Cyanobacteria bacterium HKST-UBA03]
MLTINSWRFTASMVIMALGMWLLGLCYTVAWSNDTGQPKNVAPLMLFQDDFETLKAVEAAFNQGPVKGYIHAANQTTDTFVFTYVDAKDPAKIRNVSLIPKSIAVWKQFKDLTRFDEIAVTGQLLSRPVPQAHILVDKLEVIQRWPSTGLNESSYTNPPNWNELLLQNNSLVGKVHAVAGSGSVLMFDYQQTVVPVIVYEPELTKNLWRGDKVELTLSLVPSPDKPAHLMLENDGENNPVKLIKSVRDLEKQPLSVEGPLVRFPQNPIYKDGAWAIEYTDEDQVTWNFILQGKDGDEQQQAIDQFCQRLWEDLAAPLEEGHKEGFMLGRQKYVHPSTKIKATGLARQTNPSQPNPILMIDPDTLEQAE